MADDPVPLQALHDVLPMSYAIDGLRQLVYGGGVELAAATPRCCAIAGRGAPTAVAARRLRVWTVNRIKPELVL